jgi:hypothetical protein
MNPRMSWSAGDNSASDGSEAWKTSLKQLLD